MTLLPDNPAVSIVAAQFVLYAVGWLIAALLLSERRATMGHWVVFNLLLGAGFLLIAQRQGERHWWAYGGCNLLFLLAFAALRRGMATFFDTARRDLQSAVCLALLALFLMALGADEARAPWRVILVYSGDALLVALTIADVNRAMRAEFGPLNRWALMIPGGLTKANSLLQVARQALNLDVPLELHREGLGAPGVMLAYLANAAMFNFGFMGLLVLRLVRRLRELSLRDALTGLGNRRALEQDLERETRRWQRHAAPCALLLLDLDHFKRINDVHGHEAGDLVLQEVARRIAASARQGDSAARYGGEEFVVLMPQTDAQGALVAAERFREGVAALPVSLGAAQGSITITVSIGVAVVGQGSASPEALLPDADRALYAVKAAGRNAVKLWSDEPLRQTAGAENG
jgi:diguanylate cyclase (GGDEF)-like protein